MKRQSRSANSFSSCSSESDNDSSSDNDDIYSRKRFDGSSKINDNGNLGRKLNNQNVLLKLLNRERTGYFTNNILEKSNKLAFNKVPKRLTFCLKEIVPYCYLNGHIFMGLTVCGQFLLSYKVTCEEDNVGNNLSFTSTYRYELYFWIYRPHNLLCKYFNVCLFDDHGVDNFKDVSISQWKSNPRVLIVHGDGKFENEDSYITVVAVPTLGCLDCRKLRDECFGDTPDAARGAVMCIKCNLTIHTKYCRTETEPKFDPFVNLQCTDKILIVANGLIHMIHIGLDLNKPMRVYSNSIDIKYIRREKSERDDVAEAIDSNTGTTPLNVIDEKATKSSKPVQHEYVLRGVSSSFASNAGPLSSASSPVPTTAANTNANFSEEAKENIVARIIADFAECETECSTNDKHYPRQMNATFDELVITCTSSTGPSGSTNSNKVRLLNHRNHRIITKNLPSTKSGITTIDLQMNANTGSLCGTSNNNRNLDKAAAKAYEFSEDNEKCEKISTFRKRRLADKKYEFFEENTENIIPFNKLRSTFRNFPQIHPKIPKSSPGHTSCFSSSPPTTFEIPSPHHTHRASPSCGFRSPCGSPVGNRFMMMSPPGRSSYYYAISPTYIKQSAMSPRHQSKRPHIDTNLEGSVSTMLTSPRSDEFDILKNPSVQPLSEVKPSNIDVRVNTAIQAVSSSDKNTNDNNKPVCSIKLIRRYVEEDDATSVITSEEDDCISPGYHTSLPLEVHGASYSDMQMISNSSYQKLMCPSVTITQNTLDLEAFTYYIANYLCSLNNKIYGFFFDCACEIVKICPLSCILTCILVVHFTARDIQPMNNLKHCVNCSSNLNLDCIFHRKHYESRILFTWDIDTGEWNVLDYGELVEIPPVLAFSRNSSELHRAVKKLANELTSVMITDLYSNDHLRVLDSSIDKSKDVLVDSENSIEFYRSRNYRQSFEHNYTYSSDMSDND